ncbi:MAG: hypothetical protein ACJ8BW_00910 [Ktedonobacteraceae bacterium]
MAHMTVNVPDDLYKRYRRLRAYINVSAVVQKALIQYLDKVEKHLEPFVIDDETLESFLDEVDVG